MTHRRRSQAAKKSPEAQAEAEIASGMFRQVQLGPLLGPQVRDYMYVNGLTSSNLALKELVSIALAQVPQLAIERVNRKLAYDKMRHFVIKRTYEFMDVLHREIEQEENSLAYLKSQDISNAASETVDGEVLSSEITSDDIDTDSTCNFCGWVNGHASDCDYIEQLLKR